MGRFNMPTKATLAAPFQSKADFVTFCQASQGKKGQTTIGDAQWSNKDLEPTSLEDRTWTWYVILIPVAVTF